MTISTLSVRAIRSLPTRIASRATTTRPFTTTLRPREDSSHGSSQSKRVATEGYPDSTHATDKKGLDPQSDGSRMAKAAKENGEGGNATEQRDRQQGQKKAKEEFPEAPDTIGMQDEKGR
ncbi:hypothetical protein EJ06DRAFT_523605 [Trichodelitschia bisporula]|uniref:Uncharacterized protein n=1 Tax=Trichodelitschia bisporula TaxID=703511 RepID=A0A6G1HPI6_9PEZI|nr:hypothetical protein EJ06DRAFT_523605 [Trichodelitschia bisporula]